MKFWLFLLASGAFAQTVTAVKLAEAGHSTAQILFQADNFFGQGNSTVRMRVAEPPASCEDGQSGYTQRTAWEGINAGWVLDGGPNAGWSYLQVGGLDAMKTYSLCPEISLDNGQTFHGGKGVTVLMAALPLQHPAEPIAPETWDTSVPDTSGYHAVVYASKAEASEKLCSAIQDAYAHLDAYGTKLIVPSDAVDPSAVSWKCDLDGGPQPGVHDWTSGEVDPSNNSLHFAGHGLQENSRIVFAGGGACLPNDHFSTPSSDCHSSGNMSHGAYGIVENVRYYVHVLDANAIQIFDRAPKEEGGLLVRYDNPDSGGNNPRGNCSAGSPCVWSAWPRFGGRRVVVCTSASNCTNAPETTFVPQGARLEGATGPAYDPIAPVPWQPTDPSVWWAPQLATFETHDNFNTDSNQIHAVTGGRDHRTMMAGLLFVGIHWRYEHNPEDDDNLTPYPYPRHEILKTGMASQDWTFDRNFFDGGHTRTFRKKIARMFIWDGSYQAIQNSYLSGLHYAHSSTSSANGAGTSYQTRRRTGRELRDAGGQGTPECNSSCGLSVAGTSATTFTLGQAGDRYCAGGGATCVTLTGAAQISVSGSNGSSPQNDWEYFDMAGTLHIALPPGMSGTCTGAGVPCVVDSLMDGKQGDSLVYNDSGQPAWPDQRPGADAHWFYYLVWVEPLVGDPQHPQGLFTANPEPNANHPELGVDYPVVRTFGYRFYSDRDTSCVGVRFWKPPTDPDTTHQVDLWNDSGAPALAHAVTQHETASGWQTAYFQTPVPLTAHTFYRVSYFTRHQFRYATRYLRNRELSAPGSPLHVPGVYAPSNGRQDYADNWPAAIYGGSIGVLPNSGIVWQNGTIQSGWLANIYTDPYGNIGSSEGSQCMVGGVGPGPYAFTNNYLEGSGNCWHHDDSGGNGDFRNGYTYTNNYAIMPAWTMPGMGFSQSLGITYASRHLFEWKSGFRIDFSRNVVGGAIQNVSPIGDVVEMTTMKAGGPRDVRFQDNVFAHMSSAFSGPYLHPDHGPYGPYVTRVRWFNNLLWDINGRYCAVNFSGFCIANGVHQGSGVVFDLNDSLEDGVIAHNTIAYSGVDGGQPTFLSIRAGQHELFVRDNFLTVNQASPNKGVRWVNGTNDRQGRDCSSTFRESGLDSFACLSPRGLWQNNTLVSDGYDHDTLARYWPTTAKSKSYIPAHPTDGASIGWFRFLSPASFANNWHVAKSYCAGCASPASDGGDVGANMDRLRVALAYVELDDVPHATAAGVEIRWNDWAHDSCVALDWSTNPHFPLGQFKRLQIQASGEIPNKALVPKDELVPQTPYHFRLLCRSMALTGQFQTQ